MLAPQHILSQHSQASPASGRGENRLAPHPQGWHDPSNRLTQLLPTQSCFLKLTHLTLNAMPAKDWLAGRAIAWHTGGAGAQE